MRTTTAQELFASTVPSWLLEAEGNQQDNPWCRTVYAGEQPVGFVMVAWDIVAAPPDNDGPFLLGRKLIDHHQGQDYGEQSVRQVINLVRAAGATELLTHYVEGGGNPFGFYTCLGFVPRGEPDPNGEIMLRRVL